MSNQTRARRKRRIKAVVERDGSLHCLWCRTELRRHSPDLTLDHVIPRGRGGSFGPANSVVACLDCNHERGDRLPVEWLLICEAEGLHPARHLLRRALEEFIALHQHGEANLEPAIALARSELAVLALTGPPG